MRIAVLTRPDTWHYRDLLRAADRTHQLFAASHRDLATIISSADSRISSCDRRLDTVDCVIVRAMPAGSLEQVVFRMDVLQQLVRQGVCVLNSPRTIEASVDKYLSFVLLKEHGLPIPQTGVCQTSGAACKLFEQLGGDVLVKPVFGSQGRGIVRIRHSLDAAEYFRRLESANLVIYLQKFIDHSGFDLRLLVVGDEVFTISRHRTDHWITNVSCGAQAKKYEASVEEKQLARLAARAVNGRVIGVDLVYDQLGNSYIVDVNAAPGWQAVSQTLQIDIAAQILLVAAHDAGKFDVAGSGQDLKPPNA